MGRRVASIDTKGEATNAVVPLPRTTFRLFGHEAAEELFLRSYLGGALHHAWLLTGDRGVGKATFAYRAARFLLAAGEEVRPVGNLAVPSDAPAARQVSQGAHPSLFVLSPEEAAGGSVGVEAVRKLRSFLGLTSPGGGWRALIVDATNDLTASSANALLKAIEEPPPRTVFFLVGHGAASVIPTVRSRCIRLAFRPLAEPDFKEAVLAACESAAMEEPSAESLAIAHKLSAGSPGAALELLASDFISTSRKVDRIVAALPRMDYALAHDLVQTAIGAKNAANFARLCGILEDRIEQLARRSALERGAQQARPWTELWHAVRERRVKLEALNLDKGAFLLSLFSDMEQAARFRAPSP